LEICRHLFNAPIDKSYFIIRSQKETGKLNIQATGDRDRCFEIIIPILQKYRWKTIAVGISE
jgi:hypothetical protein